VTWNPLESPVDYIVLAGQRSPGLATVAGASLTRKWDERKGHGLSGSTLVYRGGPASRFTVSIRLLTVEHWQDWDAWRPLVQRPIDPQRPRALDIEHPFLDALGIRSVVVESVAQPEQTGDGEYTVVLGLIEYRPPVRAIARPTGARARPVAVDPVDLEIERLTAQVQELAR